MTAAYLDKEPHLLGKWSGMNPLGRLGRPDEMRGVVTWLASDASSFCTGSEWVFLFKVLFIFLLTMPVRQYFGERRTSCVVEVTCHITMYECYKWKFDDRRSSGDCGSRSCSLVLTKMHDKRPQPTDIAERMIAFQRRNATSVVFVLSLTQAHIDQCDQAYRPATAAVTKDPRRSRRLWPSSQDIAPSKTEALQPRHRSNPNSSHPRHRTRVRRNQQLLPPPQHRSITPASL